MGFRKGIHYEHPPRGRARKPYTVSEAARRQRCRNLRRTRIRSDRETAIIKRMIWQAPFESGPARSQRALACELSVWHSYVHEVQGQAHSIGMEALANGRRVTLDDLAEARRFTAKLREQEPELLAPAPTRRLYEGEPAASSVMAEDERIADTWRIAREEQRKHQSSGGRRVLFSVPVR